MDAPQHAWQATLCFSVPARPSRYTETSLLFYEGYLGNREVCASSAVQGELRHIGGEQS